MLRANSNLPQILLVWWKVLFLGVRVVTVCIVSDSTSTSPLARLRFSCSLVWLLVLVVGKSTWFWVLTFPIRLILTNESFQVMQTNFSPDADKPCHPFKKLHACSRVLPSSPEGLTAETGHLPRCTLWEFASGFLPVYVVAFVGSTSNKPEAIFLFFRSWQKSNHSDNGCWAM